MPWDGNGTFSPPAAPIFPATAGELILAEYYNAVILDLTQGLANVLTRDGQNAMAAALQMATNKIIGLGAGTAAGNAVEWAQWQNGFVAPHFNTPTADNMAISPMPANGRLTNVKWVVDYLAAQLAPVLADIATRSIRAGDTYTGAHDFSGASSVTLPATTSIGPVSAAELAFLDGVTSAIQTQLNNEASTRGAADTTLQNNIDAKAAIAGQVYGAGDHDFSPGTLRAKTLPVTDSSNQVATMAALAAAVLTATLPGQSGNARKFISTDGTNASWQYPMLQLAAETGTTVVGVPGTCHALQNAAATTVTLPASPTDGDVIAIRSDNLLKTNKVGRNGQLVLGAAEDLTIDNPYFPLVLQFRTTYGWRLAA